jgi:arsenical-resistance protein 2
MAETQNPQPEQWWTAFPVPKAKTPEITADEVMKMFDDMDIKLGPREFLLVDVRRNDWEVSCIRIMPGSI